MVARFHSLPQDPVRPVEPAPEIRELALPRAEREKFVEGSFVSTLLAGAGDLFLAEGTRHGRTVAARAIAM
jgi:hypothetical protein